MLRTTLILAGTLAMVLAAPAAFAAAGDCNGDGAVDQADLDALLAANGSSPDGTAMENCDYNGDGFIGLDDFNAHTKAQSE
jgi:hypothetical protein